VHLWWRRQADRVLGRLQEGGACARLLLLVLLLLPLHLLGMQLHRWWL
jgi:hypothetical protein